MVAQVLEDHLVDRVATEEPVAHGLREEVGDRVLGRRAVERPRARTSATRATRSPRGCDHHDRPDVRAGVHFLRRPVNLLRRSEVEKLVATRVSMSMLKVRAERSWPEACSK